MTCWIIASEWAAHKENTFILALFNNVLLQNSLRQQVMLNGSEVSGELLPLHFANHIPFTLWLLFWCDSLGLKQHRESCGVLTHLERCKPVTTSGKPIWHLRKHHAQLNRAHNFLLRVFPNFVLAWPLPDYQELPVSVLQKVRLLSDCRSDHSERLRRPLQCLKRQTMVSIGSIIQEGNKAAQHNQRFSKHRCVWANISRNTLLIKLTKKW